jgi:hypothetical protein
MSGNNRMGAPAVVLSWSQRPLWAKARNRGKWARSVPRALWRFSGGVRLGRLDQSARPNRFARGWVWMTG